MAALDLTNIRIYDDEKKDIDIIKSIIEKNDQDDDPFFILDIEDIVNKHKNWLLKMPKVFPHFAVKCNPDPTVIRILAALDGKFDCASKQEIELVLEMGVSSDQIIYANPAKALSHIRYAKKVGVNKTMVDSEIEILKMKKLFPEAKLVIRIALDGASKKCGINFSRKFGCDPTTEVFKLMSLIKEMRMCLLGFSFHLGSPCYDTTAFGRGIEVCKKLIDAARVMGHSEAKLIDIGGGIDGCDGDYLDKVADSVNTALENVDPSIEVISEPGRYYVETAFTLAAVVHSKKTVTEGELTKQFYYVNDGAYGSFIEELLDIKQRIPISLYHPNEEKFPSVIWGRTCDPYDILVRDGMMQDFPIGDWMIWRNMGAYTLSNATYFNGYIPAGVFPFIRKTALKKLSDENLIHEEKEIGIPQGT